LHRLSASFVLGYHGCDAVVAAKLLKNQAFKPSQNAYDWLGEGVYFWEANPLRGLEFSRESMSRRGSKINNPAVVGAIIDLGYCLDLTTSLGLYTIASAYKELKSVFDKAQRPLPKNQPDGLRHNLDCQVINYAYRLAKEEGKPFDTVKGIFIESPDLYPGSAFGSKNHVQIAVRNLDCIKGVFRVPKSHLIG
jgi:hypothetical protein